MDEPRRPTTWPEELEALGAIAQALGKLDAGARPRVLRWLVARFTPHLAIYLREDGTIEGDGGR